MEIAMLGRSGLDINNPAQKYTLRSLPGKFSGMRLLSMMYVGFKIIAPEQDAGIDLSREYAEAKKLFELEKGTGTGHAEGDGNVLCAGSEHDAGGRSDQGGGHLRPYDHVVAQGGSLPMALLYEWVQPNTNAATVSFYLDDDFNPLNTNDHLLGQSSVPGGSSVMSGTLSLPLVGTNATPGAHTIYAKISGGGRSRYLYAPEIVQVIASLQPPTRDISSPSPGQLQIGVNGSSGQTVVIEASTDLLGWQSLVTNTLTGTRWMENLTVVTRNYSGLNVAR
jgi:hypothetical protein